MKPFFAVTALLLLTVLSCAPVSSERWYDSERSDRPGDVFFKSRQAAQASSSSVATSQGLSPNQIRVRDGDSYYTIAKRNRISVQDLIAVNNAAPPYRLNNGQVITLPSQREITIKKGDTLYSISRTYGVDVNLLARQNNLSPPYHLNIDQKLVVAQGSTKRQVTKRSKASLPPPILSGSFLQPVSGRVISGFGAKKNGLHNDGINYSVPLGTPVKAAENGVVVYAGNDLPGFGNLLLVKHANGYVTAYAHTQSFLVKQGSRVKRGQV
ncbi:MAG: LysM peptidoglycan-binding domain-containing protein, partial [Candidatus Micropelagos thuwalensis]